MNNNSTARFATFGEQAATFEALDVLAGMCPGLPPVYLTIHEKAVYGVRAQCDSAADFEAWRIALQIPADMVDLHADESAGGWLAADTAIRGIPFRVIGHGLAITREQAKPQPLPIPVVTLAEAVSLMGALPMPVGTAPALGAMFERLGPPAGLVMAPPTPGELAEQRHLLDPLDHVLEHLADEPHPFPGACEACGDTAAQWCPDCAASRQGCHGGHDDNDCTHANAPWSVAP